MPDHSKFAILILTHGRPDAQHTARTLRKHGYTGRIVFVVDDEDETADALRSKYGSEHVVEFSKEQAAQEIDLGDTSGDRRAVVFARHASFAIAKRLGLDYFMQADDDFVMWRYRFMGRPGPRGGLDGSVLVRQFDRVNEAMLTFLDETNALAVAWSQGGDHIGGPQGNPYSRQGWKRKAMNAMYFRTERPVGFAGRLNEDVTAYALLGSRGELFLQATALQVDQLPTQSNPGGMTSTYLAGGTYLKSFYTLMMCPAFVTIRTMGPTNRRLHHSIRWEHAVPKILSPAYRRDG